MSDLEREVEYLCLRKDTEAWVIFARHDFPVAVRFGPFRAEEVGGIIARMLIEGVKGSIVLNCGTEIDWQLAKDFCPTTEKGL